MNRDQRIERTNAALNLLIKGEAKFHTPNPIELAYARGETDEFVQATQIKSVTINAGDLVIFMNFRSNRDRQLSYALTNLQPTFLGNLVTLTEYDPKLLVNN